MVQAMILPGALDGDQVLGVGDHADGAPVPPGVGADGAQLPLGEILAHPAGVDGAAGVQNGPGKLLSAVLGQAEHMKSQSLGGFPADTRQALELLDELFQRRGVVLHLRTPGSCRR